MFPISGGPISSLGGGSSGASYSETITEALELHARITGAAAAVLSDGIGLSGLAAGQVVNVLIERLNLTGTVLPSLDFQAVLTDGMRYHEAMQFGWALTLQEEVSLSSSAAGQRWVLAAIADVLHATGSVNVTYDARTILTSVLALEALQKTGWMLTAVDTVEFQDALQAQLGAVAKLVDTAVLADAVSPSMRVTAICADTVDLGSALFPTMDVFERLSEEVLFYGVIRLGDAEYVGWTLNKGASTEYRNYPMNGMLEFDGVYYGTSTSGLYDIGRGEDDAGVPIDWSIKTGVQEFLTGKLKRVPDCYIAFAGDGGQVFLKVIVSEEGEQVEHIYEANLRPGPALHVGKIKIGRGIDARYWQFELSGKGKIELDEMAWRPLVLDRRLY